MFTLVNADQLNGYSRDWRRFSEIWNRHETRLEGFHSDLADDATRGDALAGDERESIQMCREARNIIEAQEIIEQKLSQIRGINIIQGGGASMFGDALGPAVHVPDFANTRAIYSTCQKTTATGFWGLIIAFALILAGIALAFWHFWKRRGQSVSL